MTDKEQPPTSNPPRALPLEGRATISSSGRAELTTQDVTVQLDGVSAESQAGQLRVSTGEASGRGTAEGAGASIASATGSTNRVAIEAGQYRISSSPAVVTHRILRASETPDRVEMHGTVDPADAARKFALIEARVFALESAFRNPRAGIGHNNGPGISPPNWSSDEQEIQHLIALLKEQSPIAPMKPEELAAASEHAGKIADKIKSYVDTFCQEAVKKAGENVGDNLFNPVWWIGVAGALLSLSEAVSSWLQLF